MQGVDLVVFDCDGVLVDSEPLANEAYARVLRRHGFDVTGEALAARFAGVNTNRMMADLEAAHGRPIPATLRLEAMQMILDLYASDLKAIEGIDALLSAMSHSRCVASSSETAKLALGLRVTGLDRHFGAHVYSADVVKRGKPAPDLFLHAAGELDAAPDRCLVVEDSLAGVEAGIAAGMRVVGFTGGSHCDAAHGGRLAGAGAFEVVDSMAALGRLLGVKC
jgi:HAD superfamily hydrolase (TIGR01509 family)